MKVGIRAAATEFYISLVPAMPEVELTAFLTADPLPAAAGLHPRAPAPLPMPAGATVIWTFALDYAGFLKVPHSLKRNGRPRSHPAMPVVTGNPAKVPFTTVTGGRLTATVTVTIDGQALTATRDDILIGGTNPTATDLQMVAPTKLMRQMMQQESGGAQFNDRAGGRPTQAINPNWSQDNLRGVGLGQLTNPPPTAEEAWNWRTNATLLQNRFRGKRQSGATLHTRIMASLRFKAEVKALNDWRQAEGQRPLAVTLPALTAEQQDWEGLRAYNGFGRKVAGEYLDYIHEFEPKLTVLTSAMRKGKDGRPLTSPPVPDVNAGGRGGWSQVSGADRNTRSGGAAPGDPDYVAHVLAQPG